MTAHALLLGALAAAPAATTARDAATPAPASPTPVEYPKSGLRTWEVGDGRRALVLLHGYGSSPRDWFQFVSTLRVPAGTRFVFPEAPEETQPPDGPPAGRAWWRLDLASHLRKRDGIPDLSKTRQPGLVRARDAVRVLLGEVQDRTGAGRGEMILGGFSQGAVVSAAIALETDARLRAIVLLSGSAIDERTWTRAMPRRRGLPVFIAHGRNDRMLPFDVAERLQRHMRAAGLDVTWVPFDGGHEVPVDVVTALNAFLARLDR